MTPETAANVAGILFLSAGREVTDETLDVWEAILQPFGDEGAVEVALEVIRQHDRPTPAQYVEALRAHLRQAAERARDRERLAALPAESEVPVPPEEARRRFAEMASHLGRRDRTALAVDDERRPTYGEDQLARLGVHRCVEPTCGRFTSRADRRCLTHVYADFEEDDEEGAGDER